jgi:hypothetical protein
MCVNGGNCGDEAVDADGVAGIEVGTDVGPDPPLDHLVHFSVSYCTVRLILRMNTGKDVYLSEGHSASGTT